MTRSENGRFLPGNGGGPGRPRKQSADKTSAPGAETIDTPQTAIVLPSTWQELSDPKKRAFLAAYCVCGQIPKAANLAQISARTHYRWRNDDPDYDKAYREAHEMFNDVLEAEAARRAVEGTLKPVYQGKELVGYTREYSDIMLAMKLKGHLPEKYRENIKQDVNLSGSVSVESVVKVLDELKKKTKAEAEG